MSASVWVQLPGLALKGKGVATPSPLLLPAGLNTVTVMGHFRSCQPQQSPRAGGVTVLKVPVLLVLVEESHHTSLDVHVTVDSDSHVSALLF